MIILFDLQSFLLVYMAIFVSLIIYNVYCIVYRSVSTRIIVRDKKNLERVINNNLSIRKVKDDEIDYLVSKLCKTHYLLAFYQILEENIDNTKFIHYLERRVVVFTTLAQKYGNKNDTKKSFFSYVLATLPIKFESKVFLSRFLLKNIISESISLRENSFLAICNCCDEYTVLSAIKLLNRNNINHSNELLSDDMYNAKLDNKLLASILLDDYINFNENYKLAVIKYISKTRLDYKDFFYHLYTCDSEGKEIELALLRYFRNHKDARMIKILLDNLNITDKNNWEYAAVSANVLGAYNRPRVINALKEAVTSRNWYVRNNASTSLIKLINNKEELESIFAGEDKYAKEIVTYKLERKGMKKDA